MTVHDFRERLSFSEGVQPGDALMTAIMRMVPNGKEIVRASEADDRHGTDFWIERSHNMRPISIDMKNREFCPIERFGSDDACIETTSVYRGDPQPPWVDDARAKPGWTVDYRKRTDFVVYTWPNESGRRFWIVPFVPLCAAARVRWRVWAKVYGERQARNNGYVTLSVYPPRKVIASAVKEFMSGIVGHEPEVLSPANSLDMSKCPF